MSLVDSIASWFATTRRSSSDYVRILDLQRLLTTDSDGNPSDFAVEAASRIPSVKVMAEEYVGVIDDEISVLLGETDLAVVQQGLASLSRAAEELGCDSFGEDRLEEWIAVLEADEAEQEDHDNYDRYRDWDDSDPTSDDDLFGTLLG
jgi:hypothetical protein